MQQRGTNPVYNVLPDIVGRLSVDETVAPAEYREIMGELSWGLSRKPKPTRSYLTREPNGANLAKLATSPRGGLSPCRCFCSGTDIKREVGASVFFIAL